MYSNADLAATEQAIQIFSFSFTTIANDINIWFITINKNYKNKRN